MCLSIIFIHAVESKCVDDTLGCEQSYPGWVEILGTWGSSSCPRASRINILNGPAIQQISPNPNAITVELPQSPPRAGICEFVMRPLPGSCLDATQNRWRAGFRLAFSQANIVPGERRGTQAIYNDVINMKDDSCL